MFRSQVLITTLYLALIPAGSPLPARASVGENGGRLSEELRDRPVDINLTVDSKAANTVQIRLRSSSLSTVTRLATPVSSSNSVKAPHRGG